MPPLRDTLSLALPDAPQTQLLRAMLLVGEPGRAAFHGWQGSVADARLALNSSAGLKQVLALLYAALRANDVDLNPALATYLRAAYVRERLRGGAYQRAGAAVLALLATAAVPVLVVGGAALAQSVYDDPLLRHASTFDLLLAAEDLDRATTVLEAAGCVRETTHPPGGACRVRLRHTSALPTVLHTTLIDLPYQADCLHDVWAASALVLVAGVPVRTLSPEDNLLFLCALGSSLHVRTPPWWVCDAFRLVTHHPDLDWTLLLARARSTQLSLPLLVSLTYLQRDLAAPIPVAVLATLAGGIRWLPLPGSDAALWTLHRVLRRAAGWRSRGLVLKWLHPRQ
jgi:hypothetical protein